MSAVSLELTVPAPAPASDGGAERTERTRFTAETPRGLEAAAPPGIALRADRIAEEGGLLGCLACGHPELFSRKDFDRRVGIAIVIVAAILAPFTWYLSLFVAAAIDALLYRFAPEVVTCYVCAADHRGFPDHPHHPRFDREIDERLKYGERAVMGKPMRAGGTADAPEPEH